MKRASKATLRRRRFGLALVVALLVIGFTAYSSWSASRQQSPSSVSTSLPPGSTAAIQALGKLAVRTQAPHTGYSRDQFGSGWATVDGCDTRNRILQRDLSDVALDTNDNCTVLTGSLKTDPYTGKMIPFIRGPGTSTAVQIDHVVALSDAWQTGAQNLTPEVRKDLANDPLELLAVDGPANQAKSDGDASEWLPPQKNYRCRYVARQIAVKLKYMLWVTQPEYNAMKQTLAMCPNQALPIEGSP